MIASSSASLAFVPKDSIPALWLLAEPLIADALDHATDEERRSGWDLETIRYRLIANSLQMWVTTDAFGVGGFRSLALTEVVDTPEGRIVGIPVVAGRDMRSWLGYVAEIEKWARDLGASWLQGQGRDGWRRVLAPFGWTIVARRDDGQLQIRKAL